MNLSGTSSSDLDPRVESLYCRIASHQEITTDDLSEIFTALEREAYFAESCAGEEFIRDQAKASLKRGETASARFLLTLADSFKQVREARFPELVKQLKSAAH